MILPEVAHVGCVAVADGVVGNAVTVTVEVVDAVAQPPVPATLYTMTDVPAVNPETTPEELTVATAGDTEVQFPPDTFDESVVVDPTQSACVPEMVPAVGGAVTVTVVVVVTVAHPPVPATL